MSLKKRLSIRSDEEIIKIIYPTQFKFFRYYFFSSILLLVASFCSFWLVTHGNIGIIVLTILILVAIYLILKAWYLTKNNFWVLTTNRIFNIYRHRFINEEISIIHNYDIGDISIKKIGIAAKLFSFGDLHVAVKEGNFSIILSGIKTPDKVFDLISSTTTNNRSGKNNNQVILNNFFKILPSLNIDQLEEVYKKAENRLNDFE